MSCQTGVQYYSNLNIPSTGTVRCFGAGGAGVPSFLKLSTISTGQIVTFASGVPVWQNSGSDLYKLEPSGVAWSLKNGSNLYSYNFGLQPFKISGSGLPSGLTLTGYNKIVGTPTQTGIFNCISQYTYCSGNPATGDRRGFTIIVCTGISSGQAYTPNFIPTLGPKFYYDNFNTGITCNDFEYDIRSTLSGQRLVLELNQPAWKYTSENYEFEIDGNNFVLESNSNLFINSEGLDPTGLVYTDLPPNLVFSKYNLITGIPLVTGLWSVDLTQDYCTGSSRTVRFSIQVLNQASLRPVEGVLFANYPSVNTIPYLERKVKSVDFYYRQENRFYRYFDSVTGYGNVNVNTSGKNILSYGSIVNPTGWRDALVYQTGTLTGSINAGESFFSWNNQSITGIPSIGNVYVNETTGTIQARNIIYFNTGLLTDGDILNINGYDFIYSPGTQSDFIFNSPTQLSIKLNSGAANSTSALNPVGVTGFVISDNLYLYSSLLQGESGNSIRAYRNSAILEAITIPNRYFTSGQNLRPSTNTWRGTFVSSFPTISAENSGNYTFNYLNTERFDNISGVVWVDTFSGNYSIRTGIKTPDNVTTYSGSLVNYIPSRNIYSGSGLIPSGQNKIGTGFNIDILKRNYYNISGNRAKYTISGSDFLYTGIIEG
jgi:hypothetical protein